MVLASYGMGFAQALPRIHVVDFTMRSDTAAPRVAQPFHIEIAGRLKEPLGSVDFVILPNLAGLEPLGDERRAIATSHGTDFNETLTVVARSGGNLHLSAAYFDAVDPRDGRPKRYYSNDLALNVTGSPPPMLPSTSPWSLLLKLVAALLVVFLAGAVLLRGKAKPTQTAAVANPEPIDETPAPEDGFRRALGALKRERTRSAVMALRSELWKTAGAHGGETLNALLSRNGAAKPMQTALRLVERAAFVQQSRLDAAIDDAVCAVEVQVQ